MWRLWDWTTIDLLIHGKKRKYYFVRLSYTDWVMHKLTDKFQMSVFQREKKGKHVSFLTLNRLFNSC